MSLYCDKAKKLLRIMHSIRCVLPACWKYPGISGGGGGGQPIPWICGKADPPCGQTNMSKTSPNALFTLDVCVCVNVTVRHTEWVQTHSLCYCLCCHWCNGKLWWEHWRKRQVWTQLYCNLNNLYTSTSATQTCTYVCWFCVFNKIAARQTIDVSVLGHL